MEKTFYYGPSTGLYEFESFTRFMFSLGAENDYRNDGGVGEEPTVSHFVFYEHNGVKVIYTCNKEIDRTEIRIGGGRKALSGVEAMMFESEREIRKAAASATE